MSRHGIVTAAVGCVVFAFAACSTTAPESRERLDPGAWRGAKSRMYQDLARQCLQAGDHERAQRLLQQAVQFHAGDAPSLELLARIAQASGDLTTAGDAARMLLRLQPESVSGWCTLGAVAEAQNRSADAEQAYRHALQAAPGDPRPGIDLHRLLLAEGREAEATALRDRLATAFPQQIEPRLDLGAHLAADGRWDDATNAYAGALAVQPDDDTAATGLALGAVLSRTPATALQLTERLPPRARVENPSLQLTLAIAHLQNGDCAAALRELELGDPVLGDRVSLRVLRGEILFRMQRLEAAQGEFERAIALAPDTARAQAGLGRTLLLQQKPHAALRCLERATQLEPGNGPSHALLTAALVAAGDLEAGRRQLALLRRLPDSAPLVAELERLHPRLTAPEANR